MKMEDAGETKRSDAEFGIILRCDAHELKSELKEATERVDQLIEKLKELRQLAEPLLAEFVQYPQGRFLDQSSKDELIQYQRELYEVLNSCKERDHNNIT